MQKILITGGAGFIGRWVTERFLKRDYDITCLDNISNGSIKNIQDFLDHPNFKFIEGDIRSIKSISNDGNDFDLCIHLAAQINVQESLDHPERSFENNILGTYNVLEECRRNDVKLSMIGTCMVYDMAGISKPIDEDHPVKPKSPYAATKLAAEEMALSYYYGYGLPIVILRPFNIYGPFQKSNMEGGVVSIFIERNLRDLPLFVYGDGTQMRDLLYVEDCADFIYLGSTNEKAEGEVINGGYGKDISINDLAYLICRDKDKIKHVPHHHPQAEISKLICDYSKAKKLLGWEPKTSLDDGIKKTLEWIKIDFG